MAGGKNSSNSILILVTPHFNLTATTAFLDPFRAANYLTGRTLFRWQITSIAGGEMPASNGLTVATQALSDVTKDPSDICVISSSWAPEAHQTRDMVTAIRRLATSSAWIGALDTGAFLLAAAGLLTGKTATVHYEHIDALTELYPDVTVTGNLFEIDGRFFSCCGGVASVDPALHLLRDIEGEGLANAAARYLFHHTVRGQDASQNPPLIEPYGRSTPALVRQAVDLMEANLEEPLSIPDLCSRLGRSQRHLSRLFSKYVGQSPVLYYRDIRLDRARGLVTQTDMKLSEVAVASGFSNQVHFSRSYREKFGLSPTQDRIDGRVPFEFRAWPMHSPRR